MERLLGDACEVVVIDNYSTGRLQNLGEFAGNPSLRVVERDIADGAPLGPHFEGADCGCSTSPRKLAARHWRIGAEEVWRSFSKTAFTKALQRLIPEITESDLNGETSGVRAQAVAADGTLLDDFCFSGSRRVLNVVNAPSPAATASLAIGRHIVREVETRFER